MIQTPYSSWGYDEIRILLNTDQLNLIKNQRITIYSSNLAFISLAIFFLEGQAKQVFLASEILNQDLLENLEQKAGSSIRISEVDNQLQLTKLKAKKEEPEPYTETKWVLATSGTTATPKLVPHTLKSLSCSTKVNPKSDLNWGLLYDPCRFAGFQVLLQALMGNAKLACPDLTLDIAKQIEFLRVKGTSAISATPTMWRKIMMLPTGKRQLDLKQITLGGEIADDRILSSLKREYPQARVIHVYASTEAGVGFSVSDGLAGFPEKYLHSEVNGVRLKVSDGQLFIKNNLMSDKYIGASHSYVDSTGYIDTGDCVEFKNGRFIFLGRSSGVVNVGGNKVHPENVENTLMSHPAVRMCKISAKKNPITGALIVASIVPKADDIPLEALKKELLQWCNQRLEPYAVPALIKFEQHFETNASGKLIRH